MIGYGNSMFLATHGILARTASGGGVDPDAQAFITAASITDPTQQSAINQLVVDLKGYSIWTKMRALYPFVGGTASTHKFNLKNPLDTNAAYRLTFFGGVTHSSNGIIGNGTNGYADTFLANNVMAQSNAHISVYSRTNYQGTVSDIASYSNQFGSFMYIRGAGNNFEGQVNAGTRVNVSNTDSRGLFLITRTSATSQTGQKNTTQYVTASVPTNHIASTFKLLRTGDASAEYSPRNLAFASIGDGLTDAEALNFYTAVQAFQTTIGRSIGAQTVSDADAQAFVTNAGIVDQVEANAINNLVIGLKADSLWTKMKAVYPFVGGSALAHKFNLKDPRDLDAAFRLQFLGGWTHSSTGATPNGTNAYANTFLTPSSVLTNANHHLSYYSRTQALTNSIEMGVGDTLGNYSAHFRIRFTGGAFVDKFTFASGSTITDALINTTNTDSRGHFLGNILSTSNRKTFKNGTIQGTNTSTITNALGTSNIYLAAYNSQPNTAVIFSTKECAFSSIGDGLTDTEAANFYTAVQTFQTALNRNV